MKNSAAPTALASLLPVRLVRCASAGAFAAVAALAATAAAQPGAYPPAGYAHPAAYPSAQAYPAPAGYPAPAAQPAPKTRGARRPAPAAPAYPNYPGYPQALPSYPPPAPLPAAAPTPSPPPSPTYPPAWTQPAPYPPAAPPAMRAAQPYPQPYAQPAPQPYPGYPPPAAAAPNPAYPYYAAPGADPYAPYTLQQGSLTQDDSGHRGFYLRLAVGAGLTAADAGEAGDYGGVNPHLLASIGAFLTENLAIHGDIGRSGPIVFGAGATYYVTPIDIYLSSSLHLVQAEPELGVALAVAAGKVWRLGGSFSIGVGSSLNLGRVEVMGAEVVYASFNAGFIATLN